MSESKNFLGPEVGYTDLLDLAISEKLKAEAEGPGYNPIRPSGAGYCARKLGYALNEYRGNAKYPKELKSPATFRLLELGHAVEYAALKHFQLLKIIQVKFKQQTLLFEPVKRGENIENEILMGSCDFVLWSQKYKAVGDVKSRKDNFSAAYKTRWDEELDTFANMASLQQLSETAFYADNLDDLIEELGDDLFVDNLYQLNLYATSDFMAKVGVDHGFIYRYNKNDSRHLEIRFRPSQRAKKYVEDKFNNVSLNVDAGTLEAIPKEWMLGGIHCAFCDYRTQCWGDDDALRAYFNTFPKKEWPKDIVAGDFLAEVFETYEADLKIANDLETLEQAILKQMSERNMKKIRLPNGNVYETKYLKSPQPHVELRRSK